MNAGKVAFLRRNDGPAQICGHITFSTPRGDGVAEDLAAFLHVASCSLHCSPALNASDHRPQLRGSDLANGAGADVRENVLTQAANDGLGGVLCPCVLELGEPLLGYKLEGFQLGL